MADASGGTRSFLVLLRVWEQPRSADQGMQVVLAMSANQGVVLIIC